MNQKDVHQNPQTRNTELRLNYWLVYSKQKHFNTTRKKIQVLIKLGGSTSITIYKVPNILNS